MKAKFRKKEDKSAEMPVFVVYWFAWLLSKNQ